MTIKIKFFSAVDCGWSSWSSGCPGSCGVGTRVRTANNPLKKHQGKDCVGDSSKDCDTGQAPCKWKALYGSILAFLIAGAPAPSKTLVNVEESQKADLECKASQYSQLRITFQWFKNGVRIANPNSSDTSLGDGKYKGTLTFSSVKREDAGLYTCKADGQHGLSVASAAITLNVTMCKFLLRLVRSQRYLLSFLSDAPFNVTVKANTSTFVLKQPIALDCSAVAEPARLDYKWHRDGKLIENEKDSQLLIQSFDIADVGIYTCTANNSRGATQSNDFEIVGRLNFEPSVN